MKISGSGQTSQHKAHMGVQRSQRDWSMAARMAVAGEEWRQEPHPTRLRPGERVD